MAVSDYGIILKWVDWVFTKILRIQAQKDRDNLERDPAGWFTRHFSGGVRGKTKTNQADNRGAPD